MIQGGGPAEGTGIDETFVNLADGPNAKIIIVPTAGGNRTPDVRPSARKTRVPGGEAYPVTVSAGIPSERPLSQVVCEGIPAGCDDHYLTLRRSSR